MTDSNFDASLDIEAFIEEIKKYPEIWNVSAEEYHDRMKKRSAWIDICRVFCKKFDKKDVRDKNEICNKLIKKWRNIKDNYLKSIKRKTKSGQAADTGRRYIYARQLSFIQQAGAVIETQSGLNVEDEEQSQNKNAALEAETDFSSSLQYNRNKRKRKHDLETTFIEFMKSTIPSPAITKVSEPNADRSFFESLLPLLNSFTEDQKLEFRSEVLNIIKQIRSQQNTALTDSNLQQSYVRYTHQTFQPPLNVPYPSTPQSSIYFPQTPSHHYSTHTRRPLSAPEILSQEPNSASTLSPNLQLLSPSTSSITFTETHLDTKDNLDINK